MTTTKIAITAKMPTPIPALKIPLIAVQLAKVGNTEIKINIFLKLSDIIIDLKV